jgi:small-conductance mechanosensitive channel
MQPTETPPPLALLASWEPSITLFASIVLVAALAKLLLFRRFRRLAERTTTRFDDALVAALERYWLPIVILTALLPAVRFSPLADDPRTAIERLVLGLLLLVLTLAGTRFVGAWFAAGQALAGPEPGRPSLVQKVVQAAVLVAGTLVVLDNVGVEIKTLLTALGVGTLAVALALQSTLTNLFAGIQLSVTKPIRVGDFIELEDGTQGHVVDIGWRATRLRQLPNNLVVLPNARLAEMRLINYSLPEEPQTVLVALGVAYGSDLRQVERVAVEVAKSVQAEVPEADPEHEPVVRFHTFNRSSIDCNVVLRARTFQERPVLIHELVIRLAERFATEGIEIPFPQRVVHLAGGSAGPTPPEPPPARGLRGGSPAHPPPRNPAVGPRKGAAPG